MTEDKVVKEIQDKMRELKEIANKNHCVILSVVISPDGYVMRSLSANSSLIGRLFFEVDIAKTEAIRKEEEIKDD